MKLLRFGEPGRERPGIIGDDGVIRDVSSHVGDWSVASLDPDTLARLGAISTDDLPSVSASTGLGPCVGGVGKIVCIGLNYADHAAETGAEVPAEPVIFLKPSTAVAGPNDPLPMPRGSVKTDSEVELGVVIERRAQYVDEVEAMAFVAGYCVVNDYSERQWQLEGTGTWDKGKGHDG